MAKFKSVEVTVDGRSLRVYLPLTPEGFLEPIVDEACAAGVLMKEDGKTPYTLQELEEYRKVLAKKFMEGEIADMKKRKPY